MQALGYDRCKLKLPPGNCMRPKNSATLIQQVAQEAEVARAESCIKKPSPRMTSAKIARIMPNDHNKATANCIALHSARILCGGAHGGQELNAFPHVPGLGTTHDCRITAAPSQVDSSNRGKIGHC